VTGKFRRRWRGGITVEFEPVEAAVLDGLLGEVVELVSLDDDAGSDDPLAAELGIGTATQPPEDPALARLLPDAYRDDDEAAADFRRYTEQSLRESKVRNATLARESLARGPGTLHLSAEEAQAWLLALTDLRLALGIRLGVTDDTDMESELPVDHPAAGMWSVYLWLGWLQETLVRAL
jgi:hypothetical protein